MSEDLENRVYHVDTIGIGVVSKVLTESRSYNNTNVLKDLNELGLGFEELTGYVLDCVRCTRGRSSWNAILYHIYVKEKDSHDGTVSKRLFEACLEYLIDTKRIREVEPVGGYRTFRTNWRSRLTPKGLVITEPNLPVDIRRPRLYCED